MAKYIQIFVAIDDKVAMQKIVDALLEKKLAACVQVISKVKSYYMWQNKKECTTEFLLLIKSKEELFSKIASTVAKLHPYQIPEITAIPFINMSASYSKWMDEVTE